MTNTLNTPIEALELEYPLHIERYELVYGSGGEGRHRGGDGLVRRLCALEESSLSLLADRRRHRPRGAAGGGDGSTGANLVNGIELAPKAGTRLAPGDVVEVRTPGGGGWGPSTTD
jgi:N-methylhydantoinase B